VRFRPDPANPGWTQEGASLTWVARIADGGPAETDSGNNSAQLSLVFCSTRSTDDGCKHATK